VGYPLRFFRDRGSIIMDTTGVGRVDFVVNGTNGNDTIDVSGDASGVAVSGLTAVVSLRHQQPTDKFDVNGLGGNDGISAAAQPRRSP
jgi:hypothetical protein